jgi:predicted RNase H-like HicB family nuclease
MLLPIAIHKEEGTVFGVTVPDIPGCHSWGDTIEDAVKNTKEAIRGHIETLIEFGEKIDVQVSKVEDLTRNPNYAGAIWAVVDVDEMMLDPTPERVNISIPRFLLRKIDAFTESHHDTRSGFLSRAAMKELSHE